MENSTANHDDARLKTARVNDNASMVTGSTGFGFPIGTIYLGENCVRFELCDLQIAAQVELLLTLDFLVIGCLTNFVEKYSFHQRPHNSITCISTTE